jgi:hypothetical protein
MTLGSNIRAILAPVLAGLARGWLAQGHQPAG